MKLAFFELEGWEIDNSKCKNQKSKL